MLIKGIQIKYCNIFNCLFGNKHRTKILTHTAKFYMEDIVSQLVIIENFFFKIEPWKTLCICFLYISTITNEYILYT